MTTPAHYVDLLRRRSVAAYVTRTTGRPALWREDTGTGPQRYRCTLCPGVDIPPGRITAHLHTHTHTHTHTLTHTEGLTPWTTHSHSRPMS
jgi:hypothetical protein